MLTVSIVLFVMLLLIAYGTQILLDSVFQSAISNKFSSGKKRDHWLDHALDDHNCDFDERCNRIGSGDKNQCPRVIVVLVKIAL